MPIRGPHIGPALRLRIGASVLTAARVTDTQPVKERLVRFAHEHHRYVAAHRQVTAVEAELRAAQGRLAACDRAQDEAVEILAGELFGEGPRARNPFARFGMPSPSRITRLPYADEAAAVHALVQAIHRDGRVGEPTLRAARAADETARAVLAEMPRVAAVEGRARDARVMRDALKHEWHAAYMALQRGTRAAADEGAPHLHAKLFPALVPRGATRRRRRPRATTPRTDAGVGDAVDPVEETPAARGS